jgi:hypothetical protein
MTSNSKQPTNPRPFSLRSLGAAGVTTKRKQQRLKRLPPYARRLLSDRGRAQVMVATAPLARQMFAAGLSPTPGMGVAEFDACVALVKDAIGLASLSDEEFEHALRLSTPPECRETSQ